MYYRVVFLKPNQNIKIFLLFSRKRVKLWCINFLKYLTDDSYENKKAKIKKECAVKRTLKLEDYKVYIEATQLENKLKELEKNNVDLESLSENHKEFIKNSRLTLKSQQRFEARNI